MAGCSWSSPSALTVSTGPREALHARLATFATPSGAVWGMQFIWPFKADYRVIYLNDDYTQTIIGREKRDYVWIMARSPAIREDRLRAARGVPARAGLRRCATAARTTTAGDSPRCSRTLTRSIRIGTIRPCPAGPGSCAGSIPRAELQQRGARQHDRLVAGDSFHRDAPGVLRRVLGRLEPTGRHGRRGALPRAHVRHYGVLSPLLLASGISHQPRHAVRLRGDRRLGCAARTAVVGGPSPASSCARGRSGRRALAARRFPVEPRRLVPHQ